MLEALLSLIAVSMLLIGSPGPAPLALAAVGARDGIRNGLPFLGGVLCGLMVASAGAALGLATLFERWPQLQFFAQLLGAGWICYLAYRMMCPAANGRAGDEAGRCSTFIDGALLNSLNPKAWAAFLVIFSQFPLPFSDARISVAVTELVCMLVAVVVAFAWLWSGSLLKSLLMVTTVLASFAL